MKIDTSLIINFLDNLGNKIYGTASDIYAIYVKQAFISGISNLIVLSILAIIAFIIIKCIYNQIKNLNIELIDLRNNYKNSSNDLREKFIKEDIASCLENISCYKIAAIVISITTLLIIMMLLASGIRHIVNPHYYAIDEIIRYLNAAQ